MPSPCLRRKFAAARTAANLVKLPSRPVLVLHAAMPFRQVIGLRCVFDVSMQILHLLKELISLDFGRNNIGYIDDLLEHFQQQCHVAARVRVRPYVVYSVYNRMVGPPALNKIRNVQADALIQVIL